VGFNLGALHIFCLTIIILLLHFLISSSSLFSKYDARNSDELLWAQENITITAAFDDNSYARKFKSIAEMIGSHTCRGSDRDIFYMEAEGWDSHQDMLAKHDNLFYQLNAGLASFVEEMKNQGHWDDVTIVVSSDFGR